MVSGRGSGPAGGATSDGRQPNFLIVGAPRCGTTALYNALKQHPSVYLAVLKEPHFFGSDLSEQPHTIRDPDIYRSLFRGGEERPRRGEASVWYLRSRLAAREIYAMNPAMKIVILLREPVAMISSLHALYLRTENEDIEDLSEALSAESSRARGERLPPRHYFPEGLQYRGNVAYDVQVGRYLDVFPRDQVHIILSEELRSHPHQTLDAVAEFLEIERPFRPESDPVRVQALIRDIVLPQLRRAHPQVRAKLQAWYRHHDGPRRTPDPALERALRKEFRPGIERLERLIGRDLSHWYGEASADPGRTLERRRPRGE